ncbi:MAG TPA: lanthionine synthetase LanC family protein [Chitinophagaceae bacterium]|nr:lanthionine synthetase LanC family protein [Chitinophagaceae bacterium]
MQIHPRLHRFRRTFIGYFFVCLVWAIGIAMPAKSQGGQPDYLELAQKAAAFIQGIDSFPWPDDTRTPLVISNDIGDGMAGKLLFFIELYRVTKSEQYLVSIRRVADYLSNNIPDSLPMAAPGFKRPSGLYYGSAGIMVALYESYEVTGNPAYLTNAARYLRLLETSAEKTEHGLMWGKYNDVLNGSAGTGLGLLYAAEKMKRPVTLSLAQQAGTQLLAKIVPDSPVNGTLYWYLHTERKINLPNFSHGTAGIGYFLARLYEKTGHKPFLDAAIRAASYLDLHASRTNGLLLLPYGIPNEGYTSKHDLGWAHGNAGSARLFVQLSRITRNSNWRNLTQECINTILKSGVPGKLDSVFGKDSLQIDNRFDLAGIANFLVDIYPHFKDKRIIEKAEEIAHYITGRAIITNNEMYWPVKQYAFMETPGKEAVFTGYFYGNAGMGLLYLKLHAHKTGRKFATRLPDDPF